MARAPAPAAQGMPPFQKVVLVLVALTLVVSVAARMLVGEPSRPAPNPMPEGARSFAAQTTEHAPVEAEGWQALLPAVTEASLFGLIGFALGYTSRKALKLLLILIAVAFLAVQVLVARGDLTVDWGGAVRAIQAWILNLQADVPIMEFLRTRIPTAIAFVACWLVGFRRG
ncbi:MAG: hypothetical protein JNK02_02600 [Planctomycetes bacterium]|nr:hypothetical protein [Planctomycetota bacterium]